jgi:hypothetical protein
LIFLSFNPSFTKYNNSSNSFLLNSWNATIS